jgi:hypothetical protein
LGIVFKASSLAVIVQGSVSRPRVKPADRIDVPNLRILTNRMTPKSPYTIEGTPLRFRMDSRMIRVSRLCLAYSLR